MTKQVRHQPITAEYVKSRLDYDPETGKFTWLPKAHDRLGWNGKHAGRETGNVGNVAAPHKKPKLYVRINIDGKLYYAHRLAWLVVHGEWPDDQIDHINGDGTDNRLANLRTADVLQNKANSQRRFHSRSPYKCVSYRAKSTNRPWRALVVHAGQTLISESFASAEEAGRAVDRVTREHFGEYAFQNFPEGPLN